MLQGKKYEKLSHEMLLPHRNVLTVAIILVIIIHLYGTLCSMSGLN